MSRELNKLTAANKIFKSAFPPEPFLSANGKPIRKLYHDGGGLYLAVHSTTAKSWLYRYSFTVDGKIKTREMGLGALADISLADARDRAGVQRELRKKGGVADPIAHEEAKDAAAVQTAKAHEIKRTTFREVAEKWLAQDHPKWTNERHRAQWPNTLRDHVYPVIGDTPVGEVDEAAVQRVLDPIWATNNVTAQRVRGRIKRVLAFAMARGFRLKGPNPAAWEDLRDAFPERGDKQEHHAAIPYADIPAFMAVLRAREGIAERALEFTILTAARSGETLGARWREIDMENRMWVVPKERMKARLEHRVPLCDGAMAILRRMQPDARGPDSLVFPGRGGSAMGQDRMRLALRFTGYTATVHGMRGAFSTWGHNATSHDYTAIEACMAHKVDDAVAAAYQHGDRFEKRRAVHDDWCAYCSPLMLPAPALALPAPGEGG